MRNILYCRNGAHLENCFQHECPGHFKCKNSYCVPYHYVCDHEFDCPWGEDEGKCSRLQCPGLLRCRHDNTCVHPSMIGDNATDCPLSGDDETLDKTRCPILCECLGYGAICNAADETTLNQVSVNIKKLTFQGATFSEKVPLRFPFLRILDLSNNNITTDSLPALQFLPKIQWLRLQENLIQSIDKTFEGFPMLQVLEMQMNPVKDIQPFSFFRLTILTKLNLSYLQLTFISYDTFHGLASLQILDISHNPLRGIDTASFQSSHNTLFVLRIILEYIPYDLIRTLDMLPVLNVIYVQSGAVCKYLRDNITCIATVVFQGRCCELIKTTAAKSFLLSTGISLTIMSAISLVFWLHIQVKAMPKFLMSILNIGTMSVAVYPFYVTLIHGYYQRSFLLYKSLLLNSYHCKIMGMWDFFAQHMSLLTLIVTLVHRFLMTAYPIKHRASPVRPYAICLAVAALVVFSIPIFLFGVENFASGAICHLMPLSTDQLKQFPLIFGILILLQALGQGAIVFIHFLTANSLRKSIKTNIRTTSGSDLKKKALQYSAMLGSCHLFFLILSFVLGMLPMLWEHTDDDILNLTSGLIIFYAMCPFLYTFGTGQFRSRVLTFVKRQLQ